MIESAREKKDKNRNGILKKKTKQTMYNFWLGKNRARSTESFRKS